MKRFFITITVCLLFITAQAQTETNNTAQTASNVPNTETFAYKLFPTQNMWTFLKLNTRNGMIWQVQWSFDEKKRFESFLNFWSLVDKEDEINGRFELYPTTNIYNFVLLDKINGRTWQVQWSQDVNKKGIVLIK